MNVYLVADYGSDDLAWAEVEAAIRREVPDCRAMSRVSLPAFDTWACSLALFQLHHQTGRGDIVFHNVAPRKDDTGPRTDNEGEALCAGWSDRGTLFMGPNSGYSWSLLRPLLSSLHEVRCSRGGSQFRSRDIFPPMLPLLLSQAPGTLEGVPEVPEMIGGKLLLIDGYGNIKTSLQGEWAAGSRVRVTIGGQEEEAEVASGAFGVAEGTMVLARGSSSEMWEIFVRGGSAGAVFGFPPGGSDIIVS